MAEAPKEEPPKRRLTAIRRPSKRRSLNVNPDDPDYEPFEHRLVELPTNDVETTIHLLKGALGTGVLAVPYAVKHVGLWFGLFATIFVGFMCAYCINMLVRCSHILCYRRKMPLLAYSDVAEQAFLDGPEKCQYYASFASFIVSFFLFVDLVGCCCVYLIFVARNLSQIAEDYGYFYDVRTWILFITIPMIFMCLVRTLKYMVPFSTVANVLVFVSLVIAFKFVFTDLPSTSERTAIVDFRKWPVFFGTVIFALECIGVVMSLENNTLKPAHFIGCPSILSVGMGTVVTLYILIGFFGYLKYGDDIEGSITLNLPMSGKLSQSVKLMIAMAIYITFTLQFYVPLNILLRWCKTRVVEENHLSLEYLLRVALVIVIGIIAIIFPSLGPFISLVGANCLSVLGFIMPSIIDMVVYCKVPGFGKLKWRLWKDIFILLFGLLGFFTGTYCSILEMQEEFAEDSSKLLIV